MSPFKIIEPTCISFSGGRTSAYMLHRVLEENGGLPKEAVVCFANTGKEDEATLKFVHDCETNWNVPIVWLEYRKTGHIVVDYKTASRNGEPFAELIEKKKFLPHAMARFCTEELKVKPIKEYTQLADDQTMVGVRADEKRRIPKMRARGMLIPLADAGITQDDVQQFWTKSSFDLGLQFRDGVTALGNCDLCFMKGKYQIASMIAQNPDLAVWWAEQENKIGATFAKDRPSYQAMLKFSKDQIDMFDKEEQSIPCFCGD